MFAQQLVNALSLGSVYALFALGFTLIFGVLGVINLAHGAVFMVGAYLGLMAATDLGLPLPGALAVAALGSGLLSALIDYLVLKPLRRRNASHLAPMIATIGVAIMLTALMQGLFGPEAQRFPAEMVPQEQWQLGSVVITWMQAGIVILAAAVMAILMAVVRRSDFGRSLRAVAESPRAAALLGVNVEGMFHGVAFLAGALGGVAGVLVGLSFNAISPFMGQPMLHKGIAVIILGGMGDIRGAMLAGLFLGFAEVFAVAWLSSDYRDAVAFGLLFLVLLVRPSGLFGTVRERKA